MLGRGRLGSSMELPRCREECPVGQFGQDCAETCDCAPGARCFPADGSCLCEPGFTGHRCSERLCPEGFYGLSCQVPCTCDSEHSLRWVPPAMPSGGRECPRSSHQCLGTAPRAGVMSQKG